MCVIMKDFKVSEEFGNFSSFAHPSHGSNTAFKHPGARYLHDVCIV